MYADNTNLEIAGQLLIAVLFLGTGIINSTTKFKQHADRMAGYNVPVPVVTLAIGFAMQYIGGFMVAFDYKTDIGAMILIFFTLAATAIFHRWWTVVDDPLRKHLHLSFVFSNCAVAGGLLLLI